MTDEQRQFLSRINHYAENVLSDINPQKVPVSEQLKQLMPVMKDLAKEKNMSVEDVFILYMDLQSEASVETDRKLRDELGDINSNDGGTDFSFR